MLHERLKSETMSHHRATEKNLHFDESMSSKEGYLKLLQAFYGFYVPVEEKLAKFEGELQNFGINLAERKKQNLLSHDMQSLGLTDLKQVKLDANVPAINSVEDAMGVLYVLEGSTMGGQIISKKLKETQILDDVEKCYHNPYGRNTMPMWLAFKAGLDKVDHSKDDSVVESAKETFSKLGMWLEKNLAN